MSRYISFMRKETVFFLLFVLIGTSHGLSLLNNKSNDSHRLSPSRSNNDNDRTTRPNVPSTTSEVTSSSLLLSRRHALVAGTTAAFMGLASIMAPPLPALAEDDGIAASLSSSGGPPERTALLEALSSGTASDETMANLIAQLEPLDPSKGNAAVVPELDGTWELIYSINAEAFSPLLNLPKPIRPTSLQLLGNDAAREVGVGRVAQVLNFPILPLSFLLSSGSVPLSSNNDNKSSLEIFPPFRFELVWGDDTLRKAGRFATTTKGGVRVTAVEAGSDADFRAINARSKEAQAAGRNIYKQRYLETTGQPGDLRISEVIEGDPVIVGAVFIHRRL